MPAATAMRSTLGRGRLLDSILDTVGNTPVIRVNNVRVDGRTIYAKAEFLNPASSAKDRLAFNVIKEAELALSRSTPSCLGDSGDAKPTSVGR
jgi:cysteine synthase A